MGRSPPFLSPRPSAVGLGGPRTKLWMVMMEVVVVTISFHLLSSYCAPGPDLSISPLLVTHPVLPIDNWEADVELSSCYRADERRVPEVTEVGFEPGIGLTQTH